MTEETGRRRRRRRRRGGGGGGGGGGGQARVFFVNQSENWNHSSSTIIFTQMNQMENGHSERRKSRKQQLNFNVNLHIKR